MSAWAWAALAGWAVAGWATWRGFFFFREFEAVDGWYREEWNLRREMKRERDTWRQQALDDRAACDAMREELQRMKGTKR